MYGALCLGGDFIGLNSEVGDFDITLMTGVPFDYWLVPNEDLEKFERAWKRVKPLDDKSPFIGIDNIWDALPYAFGEDYKKWKASQEGELSRCWASVA